MEGVSNLLLLVVRRSADKQPVATSGKSYDRINLELSSIQEKYLFFLRGHGHPMQVRPRESCTDRSANGKPAVKRKKQWNFRCTYCPALPNPDMFSRSNNRSRSVDSSQSTGAVGLYSSTTRTGHRRPKTPRAVAGTQARAPGASGSGGTSSAARPRATACRRLINHRRGR